MRKAPGSRILVAAIALLLLGSATGFVSGRHTCSIHIASAEPAVRSMQHLDHGHAVGKARACIACLLSAQFRALGLPAVPLVSAPPSVGAVGIDEPSLFVGTALPTRSARAPPLASSDSRTV